MFNKLIVGMSGLHALFFQFGLDGKSIEFGVANLQELLVINSEGLKNVHTLMRGNRSGQRRASHALSSLGWRLSYVCVLFMYASI